MFRVYDKLESLNLILTHIPGMCFPSIVTDIAQYSIGIGLLGAVSAVVIPLKESSNIIVLRPEVGRAFPYEEAVNNALLSLIEIARKTIRPTELGETNE